MAASELFFDERGQVVDTYRGHHSWRYLPVLAGARPEYEASDMTPVTPWHENDPYGFVLGAISERLAARASQPLAGDVASQTPLHPDAHESLATVWANQTSQRREIHHGVLWKMAVVKFGHEGAHDFWADLTSGESDSRQAAIHALAPHAVEFASLTHQVEQHVAAQASNPISAFWQSRTFRAEAGDLAPLLYGYEEHERAVAHHRHAQRAPRRIVQPVGQIAFA